MSDRKNGPPSLKPLSFMLRHKETWPEDFEWNFMSCDNCAMGLAKRTWSKHVREATTPEMSKAFGLTIGQCGIFTMGAADHTITPEMIADRIDSLQAA